VKLTQSQVAGMIDLTVVSAQGDAAEIDALAAAAKQYGCAAVCVLPCWAALARQLLGDSGVKLGSVVGFPSGGNTTTIKAAEARELASAGCDELDMVINVGKLRSGEHNYVRQDIRAVVDAVNDRCVKVILECHWLTDEQIIAACELCIEAGAHFVKTATGWAPSGATLENVGLIARTVADRIAVKAAGGIRDVETLAAMYRLGARRFGIGLRSGVAVLEEIAARGGFVEVY